MAYTGQMAEYSIQGSFWVDDDIPDGYVEFWPGLWADGQERLTRIAMSLPTFRAIFRNGLQARLSDYCSRFRPEARFLLPRGVLEAAEASDLRRGLALVDPEPSKWCVYPPCGLYAVTETPDGYRLCQDHAELMCSWDDLVS